MIIKCKKCGVGREGREQSLLHLHHVVWKKEFGGTDLDGRMYLCGENKGNGCHRKLHQYIEGLDEYKKGNREKEFVKRATDEWLK